MRRFPLLAVRILVVVFGPATASAEINGFQFNSLSSVGGVSLDDRIGRTSADKEHVINAADCTTYTDSSIEIMWSLNRTPASGTKYVVKMSNPGGSCSTSDLSELGTACYQDFIVSEKELASPTNNTFTVALNPLMGGDCAAGTDKSTNLYIVMNEGGVFSSETIPFQVDLKPPAAPVFDTVEEGDTNLKVSWTDTANESESGLKYRVYWNSDKFTDDNKELASKSSLLTAKSYQITGLTNGKQYYFAMVAVDKNENESVLSDLQKATPVEVEDFFERYKGQGGGEQGGFCFIATAAYGSPMEAEVVTLRAFRDRYLLTWGPGRAFVALYYSVSPPMARFLEGHEGLRAVVRAGLWPFVQAAGVSVRGSPVLGILVLFGLAWTWGLAVSLVSVAVRRVRRAGRRP
jgi:hypothetical protein